MPDEQCVVHEIDPTAFKEGLRDPRLNQLITSGWSVVTTVVLEDPRAMGEQRIALVLAPPPPQPVLTLPAWASYVAAVVIGLQVAIAIIVGVEVFGG